MKNSQLAATSAAITLPAIGAEWPGLPGSKYAGIARGEDGGPDQHIVLLNERPAAANWKDAMAGAVAMSADKLPRAFDSAYPGSMFAREDGDYIRRDDPASLAAALMEEVARRDQAIEDLDSALTQAREALREIALAGMSLPMAAGGDEDGEQKLRFHASQAWRFIGIAANALPESGASK